MNISTGDWDEDNRDYLTEARSILAGTTMMLPTLDHLRALAAEISQAEAELRKPPLSPENPNSLLGLVRDLQQLAMYYIGLADHYAGLLGRIKWKK